MNLPEIKEYRVDVSGLSKENLVTRELITASDLKTSKIVVPKHAPFFINSVVVYPRGLSTPLTLGEDYDFVSIDHELSEYAGDRVSWVFRKLRELPDVEMSYQTLGTIPALTLTTRSWYEAAALDQRPVWFDDLLNKPRLWIPMLHGHDLASGFYSFQKLVDIYKSRYETLFGEDALIPYRDWFLNQLSNLESYLQPFKAILDFHTTKHMDHSGDPHGTLAKDVPGLEFIDNVPTAQYKVGVGGQSTRHRTVAAHASNLIESKGMNNDLHMPIVSTNYQTIRNAFFNKEEPFLTNELYTGLDRVNASAWITPDGQGLGIIEVKSRDTTELCWMINPNPLESSRVGYENQWRNTSCPIWKDISVSPEEQRPIYTKMIKGGNRFGVIMFNQIENRWEFVNVREMSDKDYNLICPIGGDTSDLDANWHEYNMLELEHGIVIYRTTDYNTRPTLIWKTINLESILNADNPVMLEDYTINSSSLSDGVALSERGKTTLFPRGFSGGKYSNGDVVFSEGVDLVDAGGQVQVMPTIKNGQLFFEILIPETFSYNGKVRSYTHAHMAKVTVSTTTKQMSFEWVEARTRPYVVTPRLFADVPDANNYFDQVASKFPTFLVHRDNSLIKLDGEGFLAFGFKDRKEGDLYAMMLVPELYTVGTTRRDWNLDDEVNWHYDQVCGAKPLRYKRLWMGHYAGIQPYAGVAAEDHTNHRAVVVKGHHYKHGVGYFAKTGFIDYETFAFQGQNLVTNEMTEDCRHIATMHPEQWIGNLMNLNSKVSQYLFSVGSDTTQTIYGENTKGLIPYNYAVGGEDFYVDHYVKVEQSFLDQFGITDETHWTLVVGSKHNIKDVMYKDYVEDGQIKTRAYVFRLPPEIFDRNDGYVGQAKITRLTGADQVSLVNSRTITHTVPADVPRKVLKNPPASIHTNNVNVLETPDGRTIYVVSPNNAFGDHTKHVTLSTTIVLSPGDSLISIGQNVDEGGYNLVPSGDWSLTTFETQVPFAGLVNVGTIPNIDRNKRLTNYGEAKATYQGSFNMVPIERYVLRQGYPIDISYKGEQYQVDHLKFDFSYLREYGFEAYFDVGFDFSHRETKFTLESSLNDETPDIYVNVTDAGLAVEVYT